MSDGSRRGQGWFGLRCRHRPRGLKTGGHDGKVLGGRSSLARGLLLDELLLHSLLDSPVVALTGVVLGPLNFDESLVEAEVVSDTILPPGLFSLVKLEGIRNPLVDLSQGESAVGRAQDGHANELGVAVARLGTIVSNGRERVVSRYSSFLHFCLLHRSCLLDRSGIHQHALAWRLLRWHIVVVETVEIDRRRGGEQLGLDILLPESLGEVCRHGLLGYRLELR